MAGRLVRAAAGRAGRRVRGGARGAPRIREFEDPLPRLAAWRRTRRALTSSPATRPAPPSSCGSCSASWCSSAGCTSPPTTSPATRSRATRPSPASASAGTPRPRPPSGSRPGLADKVNRDIADHDRGPAGGDRPRRGRPRRSTTRRPSPRPAARRAGTRSGSGTTSPAVTPSRPRSSVDDAAFQAYLAGLDEQHGTTARDGAVTFDGAQVVTRKARTGAALDPSDTLAALRTAFLEDEPGEVALEMADVVPAIDAERRRGGPRHLRLAGRRRARDAELRGIERQGLPGRLHRRPQPRADRRRARADPRRREAGRGRRRQGHPGRPRRRDRRPRQRHAAGRPRQARRHLRRAAARGRLPRRPSRSRRASARWR